MISSIKDSLTKREITRIITAYEVSQCVVGHIVDQPEIPNSEWMTLEELVKKETPFSQLDIQPTKVKAILLKSDTGLVQNEFFLFSHIILGNAKGSTCNTIVSGRHRLAALVTVCDILDLPLSDMGLFVTVALYPNEKLLARSIAAYNTNRTMTGTERERVMVSSELDGEEPTAYNAAGQTTNKKSCKAFFKQVCLTTVMECTKEEPRKILTVNNLGRVFSDMFDIITRDNPEYFKQLKSGDWKVWANIEMLANHAFDGQFLDQPNEGNISRRADELNEIAYNVSKSFFNSSEPSEQTNDEGLAF